MPIKRKNSSKNSAKKNTAIDFEKKVEKVVEDVKNLSKEAGDKYKNLDDKTKKKILIGVGALTALAAGFAISKKSKKKSSK